MNKKDKKISDLEEFFDSDPTDQLPILTELAFADEAAAAEVEDAAEEVPTLLKSQALAARPNGNGSAPLHQGREVAPDALQTDLASQHALIGTLKEELAAVEAENQGLRRDAAQLTRELADTITELHAREDSLEATKHRLGEVQAGLNDARETADRAQRECEELKTLRDQPDGREAELTSENQALRLQVQDLETYVDARKSEWERFAEETQNQITALESLRESLRVKDEQAAELEAQNEDLQTELEQQVRETNSLSATLEAGHEAVRNVTQQLYATQEQLDSLSENSRRTDTLNRELEAERAESQEARAALDEMELRLEEIHTKNEQRIEDLTDKALAAEERLQQIEAARSAELEQLEQAQNDLLTVATQRDQLLVEIQDRNAQLGPLKNRVEELEEERHRTVDALTTQRQIIQNMKDELRSKLDTIAGIAQHYKDTTSKPPSIHSTNLSASKPFGTDADSYLQEPTRMFVTLDGEQALKFPIHKDTMTIGRSADNDIRIRRQFISRHHARIETDAGGAVIKDLGSKNGVMVNSVRVESQRLCDGDFVDLGEMKFRFVDLIKSSLAEPN